MGQRSNWERPGVVVLYAPAPNPTTRRMRTATQYSRVLLALACRGSSARGITVPGDTRSGRPLQGGSQS